MALCSLMLACMLLVLRLPSDTATYLDDLKTLHSGLLQGYNSDVRPAETVNVDVSFAVTSLYNVDMENGYATINGWFYVEWTEAFSWDLANFPVDYMFVSSDSLWKPSLFVDNSLDALGTVGSSDDMIRLAYDAKVEWQPRSSFRVKCTTSDDGMTCDLGVSCSTYDNNVVLLSQYSTQINTDNLQTDASISVTSTKASTSTSYDSRGPYTKTSLRYELVLTSNSDSSEETVHWNIIVPFILLSCVNLLVFLLPSETSDKVNFSVGVLMISVLYLVLFSTQLGLEGGHVTTIEVLFFILLLLHMVELSAVIVVVNIYSKAVKGEHIPPSTHRYVSRYLSRFSCFVCCDSRIPADSGQLTPDKKHYPRRFEMPKKTRVSPAAVHRTRPDRPDRPGGAFDRIKSATSSVSTSSRHTDSTEAPSMISSADSTYPLYGENSTTFTWLDIADMWDRVFFMSCLLIRVLVIVICLSIDKASCPELFCIN